MAFIQSEKRKGRTEAIDGKVYNFDLGWVIEESDSSLYVGESAMLPRDFDYPDEAPPWIASGDLIPVKEKFVILKEGKTVSIKYTIVS